MCNEFKKAMLASNANDLINGNHRCRIYTCNNKTRHSGSVCTKCDITDEYL